MKIHREIKMAFLEILLKFGIRVKLLARNEFPIAPLVHVAFAKRRDLRLLFRPL